MRKSMLFPLFFFLFCQSAAADQIDLKNGDRLTGEIVKSDGKTLTIKTEYAGAVAVTLEAVDRITSNQPLYMTLSDGQTVIGTVATKDDKLEVQTVDAGSVGVAKSSVQSIRSKAEHDAYLAKLARERNPGFFDLWTAAVDLGLSLTTGNSKTSTFALSGNAVRTAKRDKTTLFATSLYSTNRASGRSMTTANAIRGGARYEINLSDRLAAFASTNLEFDEFQLLDLRAVIGGGLGYYLKKDERLQFQIFGGGGYQRENFSTGLKRNSGEAMAGQDLTYNLNDRIQLKQRFVFLPNLTETGEYRMTFDSSIIAKLNKLIDFQITVSDRFLSNPVFGAQKNDLLLTTGVRLNLKR